MYSVVKVSSENIVTIIHTENRNLENRQLNQMIDGIGEIVRLRYLNDIAMVVNEDGFNLDLPLNVLASGLYGYPESVICGDVVFCTWYSPDPDINTDVYAFDLLNGLKVKGFMEKLIEEYRNENIIM